ncbi:MMPL family transporter [Arthrobacter sp. H14-L1]|uniref:MMPL family transporter n=1 Tax=Arthrobacter sp. H14-L1 TaxID=2996697 RepID=UPI00226D81A5|nr:MMPL family transporter [Arthrobacter sp. H14-L1]MCY0906644.1 MMPL family transporter [Arthrobacter sp. H14-L1]
MELNVTEVRTPVKKDWNPKRWLRVLLPLVLIVLWLGAAAFGGPTFGKLSSVSSNDQASFLPASAESTKARDAQQQFLDSSSIPAIVLLTSETEIPPAKIADYASLTAKMAAVAGIEQPTAPATVSIAGPIPSADKKAVEFIVPVADTENVKTVIANLRQVLADNLPAGASAYVTGPAGLTADLVNAFGGIDGVLLLVALIAVFVILLAVYRSVVLPVLVLLTSIFALTAAILLVYAFASWGWIKLSGQSQGILSILVIGASTDYSLLLVSRFREALHEVQPRWAALGRALRAAWEPILASGTTVIIALLCLLVSDLNSNRSLGPIAAIGIVFALLSSLTLLPALLAVFGRAAFWPFRPKVDGGQHAGHRRSSDARTGLEGISGLWKRVSAMIGRRPRVTWIAALVLLLAASAGTLQLNASGVSQSDVILAKSDAVDGQKLLGQHFAGGSGSPVVVIADQRKKDAVLAAVAGQNGISGATVYTGSQRPAGAGAAQPPIVKDGKVLINAILTMQADSPAAEQVVRDLRGSLPPLDSSVLVGGVTAIALDTNNTAQSDLAKIIPLVLAVILLILILLLRSIVAPLLLIGSVMLSYLSALGVSALVFNHVFHFPGADAAVPLFGFVFLVALGVDYNIFLMTRVREESLLLGTRPGILRGLGVTGGVITSAGVVLAATFAALSVIPILFLVQIAFIVAFGVLLDTVVVRSLLVPALAYDLDPVIWWPSKLRRAGRQHGRHAAGPYGPTE